MNRISRVIELDGPAEVAILADQEIEVIMEVAAYIAGRDLQEGDEKRIGRQKVDNHPGAYIIYWDSIRKGVMYSGMGSNKDLKPQEPPALWLIFLCRRRS